VISSNAVLVHLIGFDVLKEIGGGYRDETGPVRYGSLIVSDNAMLTDLRGLESLRLGRGALVQDNPSLVNFHGLEGLSEVTDGFTVKDNPSLVSFEGLDSLDTVGSFYIEQNTSLATLDGMEAFREARFTLSIRRNPNLISLRGLANLDLVGYRLHVFQNERLPLCEAEWFVDNLGMGCNCPPTTPIADCPCDDLSICDCLNNGAGTCE
jgi:hypothetical protein